MLEHCQVCLIRPRCLAHICHFDQRIHIRQFNITIILRYKFLGHSGGLNPSRSHCITCAATGFGLRDVLRLSSASHFLIVVGFVFRILPNCACERPKAIRASLNFLLSITRISPPQQARRYRPHQYPKSVFHILLNFRSFREEFRNINVHFFCQQVIVLHLSFGFPASERRCLHRQHSANGTVLQ